MSDIKTYTEDALTAALKKHDENAFQYLYKNYKGALFTVVQQIIADKEIAEDVLQEAFVTAWKNIEKYDATKGRLFTWLFNVTRNCAINTTRSKGFKSQQKNDSFDNYVSSIDEKENHSLNINQIGLRKQVHLLREDYKNVLELSYFNGFTHEEIAKILTIPVGTVKNKIKKCADRIAQTICIMDINNYIASGIIEMYVMGICSPEEKAELELLRPQYAALDAAIIQFETAFEKNAMAAPSDTSVELDNKILFALQKLQTPVVALPKAPVRKINWLRPVAAAAILLLGISGMMNYNLYKKNQAQELALAQKDTTVAPIASLPPADYAVLRDPAITPVAMYGVAPYTLCRCTMYWDKKTGKAYIMIHHLVPSPQDKKYQLWAMVNNKPVNVGMVHDEIRDHFIALNNVPEGATAFAVTLEDIKGSASPSMDHAFLYGKI